MLHLLCLHVMPMAWCLLSQLHAPDSCHQHRRDMGGANSHLFTNPSIPVDGWWWPTKAGEGKIGTYSENTSDPADT